MNNRLVSYSLDSLPEVYPRGARAIFCDDVRDEVSGKKTLVGVYDGCLDVSHAPIMIPQLHIYISIWTDISNPFKKAVGRLMFNEEVMIEESWLPSSEIEARPSQVGKGVKSVLTRIIRISPFIVSGETNLRVRIETEDGEIRAGGLIVKEVAREA